MKKLLVTTTTLPRWKDDNTPSFVQELSLKLTKYYQVKIIAPHSLGAKRKQILKKMHIIRYRYFFPLSQQNIVYDGGGVNKINYHSLLYLFKLLGLVISQTFTTIRYSLNSDYINAHWIIPQGVIGVIVAYLTNKKVVITVHGSDIHSLNNKFLLWMKKVALKKADAVIVNSKYTEQLCQSVFEREYHIIPMGISVPTSNKYFLRKKTNSHKISTIRILFIGRVVRDKGVYDLMSALIELNNNKVKFKATIVGDGPELKKIKILVEEYNLMHAINFTGWVNQADLPKYYYDADVFVGPSHKEAQGLVFAEAAACYLPLIGTDAGGIKDILVDGYNGILVKPKSSSSIAAAITKLNNNRSLMQKMSNNSKKYVSDRYDWDRIAREYCDVINSL